MAPPIVSKPPPIVRLALSDDGFGIVVGDKNAPAKIDHSWNRNAHTAPISIRVTV